MRGWVRTFKSDRGYGFIEGDDGRDYFFHLDDVAGSGSPAARQEVTFSPTAGAKGLRARSVVLSPRRPRAREIYIDPDRFIITREPQVRGHVVVRVIGTGFWGESNDPNEAREYLKQAAQQWGANAVVNLHLEKYSKEQGCSNYYYTVHRFHGHAVIIKKIGYTTDPARIAQSNADMQRIRDLPHQHSMGRRALVRPPLWRFVPALALSYLGVVALVGATLLRRLVAPAVPR